MSDIKDFRKIPLDQKNPKSVMDRMKIRELMEYERYCRDNGLYDEAASCYSDDAQIHVSWFNGPASEYWEKTKQAHGSGSKHKIFSTAVFINGNKAVAETQVMMLSPRINIQGCDMDMQSQARIFARLIKRDDEWKILYGDCIYERDELIPSTPGTKVPDLAPLVKDYRESYRNLSYVLSLQGLTSGQDLPGDDKPETVQKLYDETSRWMFEDDGKN